MESPFPATPGPENTQQLLNAPPPAFATRRLSWRRSRQNAGGVKFLSSYCACLGRVRTFFGIPRDWGAARAQPGAQAKSRRLSCNLPWVQFEPRGGQSCSPVVLCGLHWFVPLVGTRGLPQNTWLQEFRACGLPCGAPPQKIWALRANAVAMPWGGNFVVTSRVRAPPRNPRGQAAGAGFAGALGSKSAPPFPEPLRSVAALRGQGVWPGGGGFVAARKPHLCGRPLPPGWP